MSEVKDKLITVENLKNAYDDNKRAIGDLKGDLSKLTLNRYEPLDGFSEYKIGSNALPPCLIFQDIYAKDETINRVKLRAKKLSSEMSMRVVSCYQQDGKTFVDTVSEKITVYIDGDVDSYYEITIDLQNPFTIPKGKQIALVTNARFISTTSDGHICAVNDSTGWTIDTISSGNRLITGGDFSYKCCIVLEKFESYMPEYATKNYVNTAIEEVKTDVNASIEEAMVTLERNRNHSETITISDYQNETMSHTSNLYNPNNGYLYLPYFSAETGHTESIGENIVARIAKINPCNMSNPTFVTYAQKGSICQ